MSTVRSAAPVTRRLSGSTRKAVLVSHIVSSVGWLGADIVLVVFAVTATLSSDLVVVGASYYGIAIFALWAKLPLGLLSLFSGVLLGLGTKYGIAKYWWVLVKLLLNIALVLLTALSLPDSVGKARDYGYQVLTEQVVLAPPDGLIYPVIVSPAALLFAIVISVYKPWGRVRRKQQATAGRTAVSG